jgi:hypothetical protein
LAGSTVIHTNKPAGGVRFLPPVARRQLENRAIYISLAPQFWPALLQVAPALTAPDWQGAILMVIPYFRIFRILKFVRLLRILRTARIAKARRFPGFKALEGLRRKSTRIVRAVRSRRNAPVVELTVGTASIDQEEGKKESDFGYKPDA